MWWIILHIRKGLGRNTFIKPIVFTYAVNELKQIFLVILFVKNAALTERQTSPLGKVEVGKPSLKQNVSFPKMNKAFFFFFFTWNVLLPNHDSVQLSKTNSRSDSRLAKNSKPAQQAPMCSKAIIITHVTERRWLTKGIINSTDGCNHHYEEDNRNRKWKLCVYRCIVKQEHVALRMGKVGGKQIKLRKHMVTGWAL